MIYLLISLRLALPGPTTGPRQKRGRALSPEAHHPPIFIFLSLFSHTFYFPFIFLGMGWVVIEVGQGISEHCLILGDWLPHGNVIKPPSLSLYQTTYVFS